MRVEWLILADAAQVVGNKLYLMGGGWETLWINSGFPVQQRMAVAASFKVDWNETNEKHPITIEIASADGQVLAQVGGEIEAGRPPGTPPGQSQRAQIAFELALQFEKPSTYEITARVEDREPTKLHFNVVPGPFLQARQPSDQGAA